MGQFLRLRLHCRRLGVSSPLLPADRTKGNRPFQVVGVDYAGPFISTTKKQDSIVYVLLFACSLTRAIYIELMRNQTIEEFLKALKRFIARSDIIRQCKDICGCRWKFNLSRAPWWGGQFEHIIDLVKQTLVKVVGKLTLNWDKFEEVMLDIEAMLNSRPLDYVEEEFSY